MSYTEEKLGDLGVYEIEGRQWDSNTAVLTYSWGADKPLIAYQIQVGVREVIREIKAQKKFISQDEAIEVAHRGIQKELERHTLFGSSIHRAVENFFKGKAVELPTPRHRGFFDGFLFFYKQHTWKLLLPPETLLTCPHCGIATQVDLYVELDGVKTVIDAKTGRTIQQTVGFQLCGNKHVLEQNGFPVERTWALHVQDGFAYPIEFNVPYNDYEIRLKNYHLKRKYENPKIFIRPFAGIKKEASTEVKTSQQQESAHETNFPGRQFPPEEKALSAIHNQIRDAASLRLYPPYPGQVSKQPHETIGGELLPVVPIQKRRRGRPRKDPSASTSSHRADSQPRTRPEEEELEPKHLHPKRLQHQFLERAA